MSFHRASRVAAIVRTYHSSPRLAVHGSASKPGTTSTGSAKLFQDASEEERVASSSRDHLRLTQGPVWDGDETIPDAVLRMLVDAHKPLRTGDGVKHTSADDKIKGWMKGVKMEPRLGAQGGLGTGRDHEATPENEAIPDNPHRTKIPPHLHRPWHSTYTGENEQAEAPKIRHGMFIQKKADAKALENLLELQLPANADSKTRARAREMRKASRLVKRVENAREGALDYRLGLGPGEGGQLVDGDDETFTANRQIRGSSVLGAQKGGASGIRAWAGLVEDRIQRAKEAGFFKVTNGKGKPIPRDPEAGNPHIENGELLMNRIVKRQGALPPWIELQNSLDSALTAFRATLIQTYTTHLVRSVISTTSLIPLPPRYTLPIRDEAWEQRERKFHEENVRQINDLVRRMNAVAPSIVRRPLVTLDAELNKIRGETLQDAVWTDIKRRSEESRMRPDTRSFSNATSPIYGAGGGILSATASRSLSTLAAPIRSIVSGSFTRQRKSVAPASPTESRQNGQAPEAPDAPGTAFAVIIGIGFGAFFLFRSPAHTDSETSPTAPTTTSTTPTPAKERPWGIVGFVRAYIVEPILTFFRFLHLFALFAPVIISSPMLLVGKPAQRRRPGKPVAQEEDNWGAVWWYAFLVKQMERAGPSFIKLGQWAASRADLFPATLCDRMSKLHSNGHPHSLRHTKRAITDAFGMDFDDIFAEFDEEPIGCGAIAQVYKAKLKPAAIGGSTAEVASTAVAIKVLHPRASKTIRRDIVIMSIFANALNALPGMQWLSLPEEVAVFGDMMNSQLDLRVEADNLERFERNFAGRGQSVTFPKPIKLGLASNGDRRDESKQVLMEEFEDALPLKYFLRNGGGPYEDKIANIGLDAFLEMLLLDNWTHGDLHPGNIMVRFYKPSTKDYLASLTARFRKPSEGIPPPSTSANALVHELSAVAHDPDQWHSRLEELEREGYAPQLIFIDAGLVTTLDGTNRRNFLDLFQAVAEFDGYKAGKLMVARCRTPEHVIDEETFALKVQHLVLSVKSKTFSLAKIKISDILTDVLTAVRQHHVKLEGDFVNTVISILLLEGIGRQLDPNMDLFKSALPILRQLGRQMGSREAISAVPKGNIWAMAKLWVWMEAREVAGEASALDEWIRYDRLTPSV